MTSGQNGGIRQKSAGRSRPDGEAIIERKPSAKEISKFLTNADDEEIRQALEKRPSLMRQMSQGLKAKGRRSDVPESPARPRRSDFSFHSKGYRDNYGFEDDIERYYGD